MLFALVKPVEASLEELAAAAVRGDVAARRTLARRALVRVRLFAGRVGVRGPDLEDAALATLEDAFGALATFRGETSFAAWLDETTARVLSSPDGARRAPAARPGPWPRRDVERVLRELAALDERADAEPPAPGDDTSLDDLTERRIERAAFAALDRAPAAAPVPVARPRRWAWAALGACAAAVAGLIGVAALWPAQHRPRPRLDAVVALSSGGATIAGARARAGRWIGAGAAFDVPSGGSLALGLGDGTLLMLAGGTRGAIRSWTVEEARVSLYEGRAVARIARRHDRRFALRTGDLEVRAEGAILAVTAARPSSVRVLRGTALVEAPSGDIRMPAGRELVAGETGAHATPRDRASADWTLAGRRALGVHGAHVRIETTPPGAIVTLDGEPVGRTPLSLLARARATRMTVALAEHGTIQEELELHAGDDVTRRFTLVPFAVRASRAR